MVADTISYIKMKPYWYGVELSSNTNDILINRRRFTQSDDHGKTEAV